MNSVIIGCGDVGRRIASELMAGGVPSECIQAYVNSVESAETCARLRVLALRIDLDDLQRDMSLCQGDEVYYTVPPQKQGIVDERSRNLTGFWQATEVRPAKVVLISTTGVYGDCQGDWVTEESRVKPATERGKRRLDAESVWLDWGRHQRVPVVILRVPGIYSYSRLPRDRIKRRIPVVRAEECGFTNRIHADDLAGICISAMRSADAGEIFNVTDGSPGKISDYLQLAASTLGADPLPEISMEEAKRVLSSGMLSYLGESRKICNKKMLAALNIQLKYPNIVDGIKV